MKLFLCPTAAEGCDSVVRREDSGGEKMTVVVWVWAVCGIYCFLTTSELIR